mmetsp:Transcript_27684/g.31625  ORF Transcript_27684/g.31625 Transcript_27684/m.31625 type:complete len:462 (+) Transcript_27684:172-1557(+)
MVRKSQERLRTMQHYNTRRKRRIIRSGINLYALLIIGFIIFVFWLQYDLRNHHQIQQFNNNIRIQQQKHQTDPPQNPKKNNPGISKCTDEQMSLLEDKLKISEFEMAVIFGLTKCPHNTWIQNFYSQEQKNYNEEDDASPFLGLVIGCNKGYDAINMARMGMEQSSFDRFTWSAALQKQGITTSGVCDQRNTKQYQIALKNKKRRGEMHCVEPMPATFQALRNAANDLNMDTDDNESKFIITQAAISSSDGTAYFPKEVKEEEKGKKKNIEDTSKQITKNFTIFPNEKTTTTAGREDIGINNIFCKDENILGNNLNCVAVPMMSLQSYYDQYVQNKNGPIHILLIDVEGNDFDVLFGSGNILDRTHYLEFEFHWVGNWKQYHLTDAIGLLNTKGFTCYWAGNIGQLYRITKCYFPVYETNHVWSNVACVHRSQTRLAQSMETIFLQTIYNVTSPSFKLFNE